MERIKRFIDGYVPVTSCTFKMSFIVTLPTNVFFDTKLPKFRYDAAFIRKALSKDRLGGTCLINLCGGGETLLPAEVVGYTKALLEEGHYVMIVTNATCSKRF